MTQMQREQQLFRLRSYLTELKKEQAKSELRSWYEQYKAAPFDTPLR